jgi:hypothetical protein
LSSRLLPKNIKIKLCKTVIWPIVLYGGESWSLALREERRLKVFENVVLGRIFGPKRGEIRGCWRKMYNEEFHKFSSPPYIVTIIK